MKLLKILLLLCLMFAQSFINAQSSTYDKQHNLNCFPNGLKNSIKGSNTRPGSNFSTSFAGDMVHKTPEPGQFLRILILYVRFPDDDINGNDMGGYAVWDNHNMPRPSNPYTADHTFIDTAEGSPDVGFMDRYRQYTISDYFCEMSRGEFDVIGDEYSIMLPRPSSVYRQLGYNYSQINEEAIRVADELYGIDFRRYNNWTWDANSWVWSPNGSGDNLCEMIVMEYRKAPEFPENNWFINVSIPVSGISDLGFSTLTLDSTLILGGSGVTCLSILQNYSKMTQIILHEISHRYFFTHYEIGLMTGVEHSCFNYSPYERKKLEYISPHEIRFPNPLPSEEFTLGDYISTGDVLEIELPAPGEKYYIANHQKKSVYDGISRGGKGCWSINKAQQDPYCPDGKGLYIYHEMAASRCNDFKELNIVQADGNHDWYVDRMVPYFDPFYNFDIPLFETSGGNVRGKAEFHQVIDPGFTNMQEVSDNPCSDNPDDYFVTFDWLGDGKDAFNVGYNEIFSSYSNPRTLACDGSTFGLTVKVLETDSVTGSIKIKIYYDDNLAVQELPPSKPMNLKTSRFVIDSLTGRFHPELRWDKNIEPDFVTSPKGAGHYNIYRGIFTTCSPDSLPEFSLAGTIPADSSSFIDEEIFLYPEGGGKTVCEGLFRSIYYKIEAVDITKLASVNSDASIINGYTDPCDDSIITVVQGMQLPVKFAIFNYPNPFNPVTKIKYSLPENASVTLRIFNAIGQEISSPVKNEYKPRGYYDVLFDGTNLPSGVYFYKIEAYRSGSQGVSYVETRKMVLIK